jgi:hypothetical protein
MKNLGITKRSTCGVNHCVLVSSSSHDLSYQSNTTPAWSRRVIPLNGGLRFGKPDGTRVGAMVDRSLAHENRMNFGHIR